MGIGNRIAHRFFLVLVLLAITPVALVGYGTYRFARAALIETAVMHMETIAEDHANHLDFWLQERLNDLEIIANLPAVRAACRQCTRMRCVLPPDREAGLMDDLLSFVSTHSSVYEALHILAADGRLIGSTRPGSLEPERLESLPVFRKLREISRTAVGLPYPSEGGTWHVRLGVPVVDEDRRLAGYILVVVDLSKTLDPVMTDRAGLGKTGETYLVTSSGEVITTLRSAVRDGTASQSLDSPGIRRALAGETGSSIYSNYRDREVLGAYRWLPRYDWAILAEMETTEILEPVRSIRFTVSLSVAAVILASLLAAHATARRLTEPVIRMSRAAKKMARGDFSETIEVRQTDEVGALAESFNHMSRQIEETLETLRHKEQSLREAYENQKSLQERLVQSEKLAAIGEVVAGIVHEMRNPLSSVKLNLQILGRALSGRPALGEHHQIAMQQVGLLEAMFRDLLNYSKPLSLEMRPLAVQEVLEKALTQMEGTIRRSGARVTTGVPEDLPPVHADLDRAVQAIVNVLKNALEAAGPGAQVDIRAEKTRSGNRTFVELAIRDNGPGIPAQNLSRVFQPFFTTRKKGTGLGLSIVRKILEAHGGYAEAESPPGEGTTIRLRFPSL